MRKLTLGAVILVFLGIILSAVYKIHSIQAAFDRVEVGMDEREVQAILGPPDNSLTNCSVRITDYSHWRRWPFLIDIIFEGPNDILRTVKATENAKVAKKVIQWYL